MLTHWLQTEVNGHVLKILVACFSGGPRNIFFSLFHPFKLFFYFPQRESSRDQGEEGTSSNVTSTSIVPPFQKVLMNFLDNYAPVVGKYLSKKQCSYSAATVKNY